MAEEKNCINADEYLANNPFMRHNHMKIERISTECSEISMEVHPDGLNIMGMIHGGLLYSLADVVTGLTARGGREKICDPERPCELYRQRVPGEGDSPGDPGAPGPGHRPSSGAR